MCGICGIVGEKSEKKIKLMCDSLIHRGPDQKGYYLSEDISLGHQRLSIIDLSEKGRQPISNEDKMIWVIFNGEIYNFEDIKAELAQKGHIFDSKTDSEVIVHAYEEYGENCVSLFNGMFAFAIWDEKKRKLLLCRDRMGQKPLYYCCYGNIFIFASELKAILKYPGFRKEIDFSALARYLLYEFIPLDYCIFRPVKKLSPGHLLTYTDDKKLEIKKYWDISFPDKNSKINPYGKGNYKKEILKRLKESVKARLISDVPLGVFLSGGIDSSAVLAMMAEIMPGKSIKTFSIGFKEKSFDESNYARFAANYFGSDHKELVVTPKMLLEVLPEVIGFLDEPFADASIIPTYVLSKFTRKHVKVALGGDGGDELFAGYPTFQAQQIARYYEKIPGSIHKNIISKIIRGLPASTRNISFDFKLKQFCKGAYLPLAIKNQVWLGSFSSEEIRELFNDTVNNLLIKDNVYEDLVETEKNIEGFHWINQLVYLHSRFYLDGILIKVDRASMACSLEVRDPFLDYRFVEFINGLPPELKLNRLTTKSILKEALKEKLPSRVTNRKKKGFGVPVAEWIKSDLRGEFLDTLSKEKIEEQGIFNYNYIAGLLKNHLNGKQDNRKKLWALFMFMKWWEKYLKGNNGNPVNIP